MAGKTTTKELREKTHEELAEMLSHARERVRQARFDVAANNMKSISVLRDSRKRIAQILTLLNHL